MDVVDSARRVHGIAGRRVADASERVADLVRETRRLAARLFPPGGLCTTVASPRQPAGRKAR
jgi:hypothetical protein